MLWRVLTATPNVQDVGTRGGRRRLCSQVCKGFTPEQILQLATPTYREHKSKEKKFVSSSPAPTLVDPSHVSVLGKVEGDKVVQPETTPAAKKTKRSESPKPSANKKKSSSGSRQPEENG